MAKGVRGKVNVKPRKLIILFLIISLLILAGIITAVNIESKYITQGPFEPTTGCFVVPYMRLNNIYSCYFDDSKEIALRIYKSTDQYSDSNLKGIWVQVKNNTEARIFVVNESQPNKDIRMLDGLYNQPLKLPKYKQDKDYVINLSDIDNASILIIAPITELNNKEKICDVSGKQEISPCKLTNTSRSIYWGDPLYRRMEGPEYTNECSDDSYCTTAGCSGEICVPKTNGNIGSRCEFIARNPNTTCKCLNTFCVWQKNT